MGKVFKKRDLRRKTQLEKQKALLEEKIGDLVNKERNQEEIDAAKIQVRQAKVNAKAQKRIEKEALKEAAANAGMTVIQYQKELEKAAKKELKEKAASLGMSVSEYQKSLKRFSHEELVEKNERLKNKTVKFFSYLAVAAVTIPAMAIAVIAFNADKKPKPSNTAQENIEKNAQDITGKGSADYLQIGVVSDKQRAYEHMMKLNSTFFGKEHTRPDTGIVIEQGGSFKMLMPANHEETLKKHGIEYVAPAPGA